MICPIGPKQVCKWINSFAWLPVSRWHDMLTFLICLWHAYFPIIIDLWHAYIPNVPVKFLIMVPSIAIAFDLSYMYHFPSCNHAHSHNFRSPLIAKCNTICLTPTQGALLSAERCIARKCVDKVLELHSQFCYFCLVVWRGVSPNKMLCPMKGWEVIMHFSFLWLHVRLSCHMHLCVCVCMWM